MTTPTNHTDTQRMSQLLLSRNMLLISAAVAIACQFPEIQIVADENTAWMFDVRYIGNLALSRQGVYVADLEVEVRLLLADIRSIPPETPYSSVRPIHTNEHPFCSNADCVCKDDHVLVARFVMMPLELHQVNGAEAMRRYWGQVEVA